MTLGIKPLTLERTISAGDGDSNGGHDLAGRQAHSSRHAFQRARGRGAREPAGESSHAWPSQELHHGSGTAKREYEQKEHYLSEVGRVG
jgi:hypothetical protein